MFRSKLVLITVSLVLLMSLPMGQLMAQVTVNGTGTASISDGSSRSDSITITMTGVDQPDSGKQYNGWLVSDDSSSNLNLGVVQVDPSGGVSHSFSSSAGDNLISSYSKLMLTEEAAGTTPASPVGLSVFSHQIPTGAVAHVRSLLSDSLNLQTQLASAQSSISAASAAATIADVQSNVTTAITAIDAAIALSSDNTNAGLASAAAPNDATITAQATLVDINLANATTFANQAKTEAQGILALTAIDPLGSTGVAVGRVASILGAAQNGLDANADGTVESISGEGAAAQAYSEAQGMTKFTLAGGTKEALVEAVVEPVVEPVVVVEEEPAAAAPSVGDAAIPLLAQISLVTSVALMLIGGLMLIVRRKFESSTG
jgi:hypothetical protein